MISSSSISLKNGQNWIQVCARCTRICISEHSVLTESVAQREKVPCIGSLRPDTRRQPLKIGPRGRIRIPKVIPVDGYAGTGRGRANKPLWPVVREGGLRVDFPLSQGGQTVLLPRTKCKIKEMTAKTSSR